jgi:hypothetical protein
MPNKRLLLAYPVDGHDTFRPSGDYDGPAPSIMEVVPESISEERAAALRKSAEVETTKDHEVVYVDDEHKRVSLCFSTKDCFLRLTHKATRMVSYSGIYTNRQRAKWAYYYKKIRWRSFMPYRSKP